MKLLYRSRYVSLTGVALLLAASATRAFAQPLEYTGVNLSGAEFAKPRPGVTLVYGKNFIYPDSKEFDYFAAKGVNIIRLPFRWEVIQPEASKDFAPTEIDRLKGVVSQATAKGLVVILDPHNFARYYGKVIGGPEVPDAAFADLWSRLAAVFKNDPRVWFGLVNEPYGIPPEQWLKSANAAIAAIRQAGANNRILVPGVAWTGAHSWISSGNAAAMLGVVDPRDNYIFEVHQYLDQDSSGTKPEVVSATIGSERLRQFTLWCQEHHKRALLGEFAGPGDDSGAAAISDMLRYMERNRDVWVGFTWWSAGPWWGSYMFSLEPRKDGTDAPQLTYLRPHLQSITPPGLRGTAPEGSPAPHPDERP